MSASSCTEEAIIEWMKEFFSSSEIFSQFEISREESVRIYTLYFTEIMKNCCRFDSVSYMEIHAYIAPFGRMDGGNAQIMVFPPGNKRYIFDRTFESKESLFEILNTQIFLDNSSLSQEIKEKNKIILQEMQTQELIKIREEAMYKSIEQNVCIAVKELIRDSIFRNIKRHEIKFLNIKGKVINLQNQLDSLCIQEIRKSLNADTSQFPIDFESNRGNSISRNVLQRILRVLHL